LQERCKGLEKLFGVCRNAAKASKNFLAFAELLQAPFFSLGFAGMLQTFSEA